MAGDRLPGLDQRDARGDAVRNLLADQRVVRAAQDQGVGGITLAAEGCQRRKVTVQQLAALPPVAAQRPLLDRRGQAVAGDRCEPHGRVRLAHRIAQGAELAAGQRAARGQHAHVAGARVVRRGLEGGLDRHHGPAGVVLPHGMGAGRAGGVAGDHQQLGAVRIAQVQRDGQRALGDEGIAALAIGRVRAVGDVDDVFARQGGAQRLQHRQAADAAVEHADGCGAVGAVARWRQAAETAMPLNSPLAMRFSQSAGPVMCALVPPASTATVTGMSTTSNS